MNPTDQFISLKDGKPVFSTNDPQQFVVYHWGRSVSSHMLLNFEKVLQLTCPNLEHIAVFVGTSTREGMCSMCGEPYGRGVFPCYIRGEIVYVPCQAREL